jgi:hypothetical protein
VQGPGAGRRGNQWPFLDHQLPRIQRNKLLAMIGGRIVDTPNFAGVDRDTLDLPLEDIDGNLKCDAGRADRSGARTSCME